MEQNERERQERERQAVEIVRHRAGFAAWCLRRLGFTVTREGVWWNRRTPAGVTTGLWRWPWKRRAREVNTTKGGQT